MDLRIKICGITQPAQAVAIAKLRGPAPSSLPSSSLQVSTLGFICVKKSPRYVEPKAIAQVVEVLETADCRMERVGVFAQADPKLIQATVEQGRLSGVQLHGDETLEQCKAVRQQLDQISLAQGQKPIELIKAVRVRSPEDLEQALMFTPVVDALLLDAYHPQMLGGTGHTLDWSMLQQFAPGCPWLLAGGLNPDNIADALERLRPAGIDLSSGVENAPGDKNIDAVQTLLNNIQP